jgi:hypothetical protein
MSDVSYGILINLFPEYDMKLQIGNKDIFIQGLSAVILKYLRSSTALPKIPVEELNQFALCWAGKSGNGLLFW